MEIIKWMESMFSCFTWFLEKSTFFTIKRKFSFYFMSNIRKKVSMHIHPSPEFCHAIYLVLLCLQQNCSNFFSLIWETEILKTSTCKISMGLKLFYDYYDYSHMQSNEYRLALFKSLQLRAWLGRWYKQNFRNYLSFLQLSNFQLTKNFDTIL